MKVILRFMTHCINRIFILLSKYLPCLTAMVKRDFIHSRFFKCSIKTLLHLKNLLFEESIFFYSDFHYISHI